ncbi:MAG: preprotein translocase subunit SecG [Clostridium sp.]|nr:preprotein translocase subunit SecG [Clostridium sp.]MDY3828504.1 preprotein translocase subunit SecG [Clostridium sp.]
MHTALLVLEIILSLVVIISALMQPSKSDALSGLIQGSSNETFFSKNKARTKEVILSRITVISMILLACNTMALQFIL